MGINRKSIDNNEPFVSKELKQGFLFITGFLIVSPNKNDIIKDETNQNIVVDATASDISEITAVDLFHKNGTYYDTLWSGKQPIVGNKATISFLLEIDLQIIPGIFFYRIWGQEPNGPNCFSISQDFEIKK